MSNKFALSIIAIGLFLSNLCQAQDVEYQQKSQHAFSGFDYGSELNHSNSEDPSEDLLSAEPDVPSTERDKLLGNMFEFDFSGVEKFSLKQSDKQGKIARFFSNLFSGKKQKSRKGFSIAGFSLGVSLMILGGILVIAGALLLIVIDVLGWIVLSVGWIIFIVGLILWLLEILG
jgi:hypothetical protein